MELELYNSTFESDSNYRRNHRLGNHLKTGHTLSLQNRPKESIQNKSSYSAPSSLVQYFL
jgi:hypothetical protein